MMQVKEKNRREIEARLKGMGDYVKMGYLSSCLKQGLDFDSRKYSMLQLSELYEKRKMFLDAGKMIQNAASINTSNIGKITDYIKAGKLFTKAGDYERADEVFHKAISLGDAPQRLDTKKMQRNLYLKQAENFLTNDKRNRAMEFYERLLMLELSKNERELVQEKLLFLYNRLGKIREYSQLKQSM